MNTAELIEKIEKIKLLYRILIFVGTLSLLCGLYFWLVHIPKSEDIAKFEKKNKGLVTQITEAKQKTKNLAKFEEDMEQVKAQYEEALTLLPKKEEIPSLLRNITELGTSSNLEFSSFAPSKGPVEHMYTQISASIVVKGRYHDVLLFFDRVGKMKRIVNIKNVNMSPMGDSGDLSVNCKAITYKFNN
jgi:type IV pilus assembly protein PilO